MCSLCVLRYTPVLTEVAPGPASLDEHERII